MTHHDFATALAHSMGLGEPSKMPGLLEPFRTDPTQRMLLDQTTHLDTSRARAALDWEPQFTTKSAGLDKMFMQWRAESALDTPDDSASDEVQITAESK
jgi:nucleoside-diphosphate-sugar epimerase